VDQLERCGLHVPWLFLMGVGVRRVSAITLRRYLRVLDPSVCQRSARLRVTPRPACYPMGQRGSCGDGRGGRWVATGGVTALILAVLGATDTRPRWPPAIPAPQAQGGRQGHSLAPEVSASAAQVASASTALATANAQLPHARATLSAARAAQGRRAGAGRCRDRAVAATAQETLRVARSTTTSPPI